MLVLPVETTQRIHIMKGNENDKPAKTFISIEELFKNFWEEIYPFLSKEDKADLKDVKYDFENGRGVSEKRKRKVLEKFGEIKLIFNKKNS